MSIKDSHSRKVSFDTREELGDKIDKLMIMIGKFTTRDSGAGRQFKPQTYQGKGRGQNRGNCDTHENSGISCCISYMCYIAQCDLINTCFRLPQVWYIPGRQHV